MNNGNVGWYFDNPSIPSYRVRGLLLGTTTLQITDQFGKVGQVTVTVRPKQQFAWKYDNESNTATFLNFQMTKKNNL